MKLTKITLLSVFLFVLAGCETDYDMPGDNISLSSVGEVVEIVTSNAEAKQDVADIHTFSEYENATVVNIVDGDTVDLKFEGSADEKRVRFILINAPELENSQPYAIEAANFTKMLLLGNDVLVEYDVERTDRYGRTLAYLWLAEANYEYDGVQYQEKGVMINDLLLKHGLAHVAVYKPNVFYKEHFYAIENKAKQNRVGMWE